MSLRQNAESCQAIPHRPTSSHPLTPTCFDRSRVGRGEVDVRARRSVAALAAQICAESSRALRAVGDLGGYHESRKPCLTCKDRSRLLGNRRGLASASSAPRTVRHESRALTCPSAVTAFPPGWRSVVTFWRLLKRSTVTSERVRKVAGRRQPVGPLPCVWPERTSAIVLSQRPT
jgi:hypothetical protein